MRSAVRLGRHAGAGIVGFVIGTVVAFSLQAGSREQERERAEPVSAPIEIVDALPRASGSLLLAWARDGLRPGIDDRLAAMRGIRAATAVEAGLDWITKTEAPDGSTIDRP